MSEPLSAQRGQGLHRARRHVARDVVARTLRFDGGDNYNFIPQGDASEIVDAINAARGR